ncbi:hypothetical protein QBC40DRAFT_344581 [Triangularia verruculosa]|uniref:Uncharacterized protein n=1 Tax=Triangularia verruculosa TaxID=2587418 RepID=A0AAN6XY55_9PEZI|nr:hypothetical protein QBC40DRAFT_344581 [Triangularia verruculosa]
MSARLTTASSHQSQIQPIPRIHSPVHKMPETLKLYLLVVHPKLHHLDDAGEILRVNQAMSSNMATAARDQGALWDLELQNPDPENGVHHTQIVFEFRYRVQPGPNTESAITNLCRDLYDPDKRLSLLSLSGDHDVRFTPHFPNCSSEESLEENHYGSFLVQFILHMTKHVLDIPKRLERDSRGLQFLDTDNTSEWLLGPKKCTMTWDALCRGITEMNDEALSMIVSTMEPTLTDPKNGAQMVAIAVIHVVRGIQLVAKHCDDKAQRLFNSINTAGRDLETTLSHFVEALRDLPLRLSEQGLQASTLELQSTIQSVSDIQKSLAWLDVLVGEEKSWNRSLAKRWVAGAIFSGALVVGCVCVSTTVVPARVFWSGRAGGALMSGWSGWKANCRATDSTNAEKVLKAVEKIRFIVRQTCVFLAVVLYKERAEGNESEAALTEEQMAQRQRFLDGMEEDVDIGDLFENAGNPEYIAQVAKNHELIEKDLKNLNELLSRRREPRWWA